VASERDEAKRTAFRAQVAPWLVRGFIFVDETSTHTAMTRRYVPARPAANARTAACRAIMARTSR